MTSLLHITTDEAWQAAQAAGVYHGDTLETEGFIHCSLLGQVVDVANARYRGRDDLVLLVIDEARVEPEVRYEDCYETGQDFPHIYGPLDLDAVMTVLSFPPDPDGMFTLPEQLVEA
jgi:uncharacterized protein (DUF952 family)